MLFKNVYKWRDIVQLAFYTLHFLDLSLVSFNFIQCYQLVL